MAYGVLSVFPATIASGASTSSDIVLDRSYKNVLLQVGTMSTGVNIQVEGKALVTDTYKYLYHPAINSSTVTTNQFIVSGAVGSGGGIVPVPNGLPYMRIRLTGVVSGGVSFQVICSD